MLGYSKIRLPMGAFFGEQQANLANNSIDLVGKGRKIANVNGVAVDLSTTKSIQNGDSFITSGVWDNTSTNIYYLYLSIDGDYRADYLPPTSDYKNPTDPTYRYVGCAIGTFMANLNNANEHMFCPMGQTLIRKISLTSDLTLASGGSGWNLIDSTFDVDELVDTETMLTVELQASITVNDVNLIRRIAPTLSTKSAVYSGCYQQGPASSDSSKNMYIPMYAVDNDISDSIQQITIQGMFWYTTGKSYTVKGESFVTGFNTQPTTLRIKKTTPILF